MIRRLWQPGAVAVLGIVLVGSRGDSVEPAPAVTSAATFEQQVRPLLQKYCFDCHAAPVTEADLDLAAFTTVETVRRSPKSWVRVREMLDSGQMPPREADQPGEKERQLLRTWVRGTLTEVAAERAGDPGPVLLRRLSNAEYAYTVQDLTGVHGLDPTREFPEDGAAGEGFTNTGSGQGMSAALVQKYLAAAKEVAAHVVLVPDGIRFSKYDNPREQTDELVQRIRAFYSEFTAEGGGQPIDLQGIQFDTNQGGVLPVGAYLTATLGERSALQSGTRTIAEVAQARGLNAKYLDLVWQAFSVPASDPPQSLLDTLRNQWRQAEERDAPRLAAAIAEQQKRLWKFNPVGHIGDDGKPKTWMEPIEPAAGDQALPDVDHAVRDLFPPALCYPQIVPVDEVVTVTLYYRQDEALQRLMLGSEQIAVLNRLWDELLFVSQEPLKYEVAFEQIREFATQDRPDLVQRWAPLVKAVTERAAAFRQRLHETESVHVQAVMDWAGRAWRRPLAAADASSLREFYQSLREGGLDHEPAVQLLVARVLTAPAFLYKLEQPGPGSSPAPVNGEELATRLSYFLWSSLPDEPLRRAAAAGSLQHQDELLAQTRRMLRDGRTRRLAIQFACQWLHARNFDQNDDKNEQLFPEFATLRGDMYEELVRFWEDLFRHDRSILLLLDADHAFVSPSLARHYGVVEPVGEWTRLEGWKERGRGGVLGMAAILASQSGASRTSPILRGNWVYETLLGERLPRPPANVPQLPETVPAGLTERQLIEKHSADAACAKCHAQIDPYGFALEQFDAIGRTRADRVATSSTLPDGITIDGLPGLRDYLLQQRRGEVVEQFCRKLLGFALGREVQLTDEPLLAEMQTRLAAADYRFHVAVEAIVTSRQFREIRGGQEPSDEN